MGLQPWVTGPKEILQHGLSLLHEDSDRNRRLALLSIDNAVELTIKTYLGLPKRVTGIQISRRDFAEISDSFPKMLDALEEHASELLEGIDLGDIEWFHRLRNQLYHQGNGLTVAREQVEVYAELAKLLFRNLFNDDIPVASEDEHLLLGQFLAVWVDFEKLIASLSEKNIDRMSTLRGRPRPPMMAMRELLSLNVFSPQDAEKIEELRRLRNEVVHGAVDFRRAISRQTVEELRSIVNKYGDLGQAE
ncbi:MAG: hypothetical protein F6K04_25880 [Leptolyngbya sp. SIO4C5]|nr:hypothetical protein [Leptolyngbya sp. SIO4C5]